MAFSPLREAWDAGPWQQLSLRWKGKVPQDWGGARALVSMRLWTLRNGHSTVFKIDF